MQEQDDDTNTDANYFLYGVYACIIMACLTGGFLFLLNYISTIIK